MLSGIFANRKDFIFLVLSVVRSWRGFLTQRRRELGVRGRNRPLWVGATHREATKPSGASAEESGVRRQ